MPAACVLLTVVCSTYGAAPARQNEPASSNNFDLLANLRRQQFPDVLDINHAQRLQEQKVTPPLSAQTPVPNAHAPSAKAQRANMFPRSFPFQDSSNIHQENQQTHVHNGLGTSMTFNKENGESSKQFGPWPSRARFAPRQATGSSPDGRSFFVQNSGNYIALKWKPANLLKISFGYFNRCFVFSAGAVESTVSPFWKDPEGRAPPAAPIIVPNDLLYTVVTCE